MFCETVLSSRVGLETTSGRLCDRVATLPVGSVRDLMYKDIVLVVTQQELIDAVTIPRHGPVP
jgi:hypothetical protein